MSVRVCVGKCMCMCMCVYVYVYVYVMQCDEKQCDVM